MKSDIAVPNKRFEPARSKQRTAQAWRLGGGG